MKVYPPLPIYTWAHHFDVAKIVRQNIKLQQKLCLAKTMEDWFWKQRRTRFLYSRPRQLSTDFDIYEWICVKKNSLTKLQPWSQENVHHWEDEVGEEVVVDLGEFAPQAGRIPESGLKVVSYALGDHRNLFQKVKTTDTKRWTRTKARGVKMWIPGVISMVTYIILTKKKRSKTARAINRLLKLLLKLRLRSTFLSLTLVADFEQEDRTVPEEAHPDDFVRSARTP